MPQLIGAQAQAVPDAVAVACGDRWLSYAELEVRAARLARTCWPRRGRGRRRWWGCAWSGRPELITALLGGAGRPGRRTCRWIRGYPAERIAFMLADAGPGCWSATGGGIGGLAAGPVRVLAVDDPRVAAQLARRAGPAAGPGGGAGSWRM